MKPTGKERSALLASIARSIIEQDGMDRITNGGKLLPMADRMMKESGCTISTAKRHLAKQLRLMRGELLAIDGRGGKREGAGRPPNEKDKN